MTIFRSLFALSIVSFSFSLSKDLPNGFVYLNQIIPNIKFELKYFSNDNFVGEKISGYNSPVGIATRETAYTLKEVQNDLKHFGHGLKIFDAYRNNNRKMKSTHYPKVKKKNLFKEGYIASKSGHTRGSTVDLTIIDLSNGQELDMGTIYDYFGKESWIENPELTDSQRTNRLLLQSVMKKYGFIPLKEEWWHFTLSNEPFPDTYFNFIVE